MFFHTAHRLFYLLEVYKKKFCFANLGRNIEYILLNNSKLKIFLNNLFNDISYSFCFGGKGNREKSGHSMKMCIAFIFTMKVYVRKIKEYTMLEFFHCFEPRHISTTRISNFYKLLL